MGYWDNQSEYAARGIDYDLAACLEFNPQDGFVVEDIAHVLAVFEGENEGEDWRWILRLTDGRLVYLRGGCDYTGWDCISSASHGVHTNIKSLFTVVREDNPPEVIASLTRQLTQHKDATWSETFSPDEAA